MGPAVGTDVDCVMRLDIMVDFPRVLPISERLSRWAITLLVTLPAVPRSLCHDACPLGCGKMARLYHKTAGKTLCTVLQKGAERWHKSTGAL